MTIMVGADVGGTFTDIIAFADGEVRVAKVPTTPDDQSRGLMSGVAALGLPAGESTILHGTTVATNALLERKGVRCGLIATCGFRDLLELRRRDRRALYGLTGTFEPLVPRELRLEVRERTTYEGVVETPLDERELAEVAGRLVEAGCRVIVVAFLHSYVNSANEQAAADAIARNWPELDVVLSSDVVPEWREFERTSTAVAEGYIRPVLAGYLSRLEERLEAEQLGRDVLILQSNGGLMASETARARPVNTVLSGPAGGVIAAAAYGRMLGWRDLVSLDMGGTSTDVSLVLGGSPTVRDQSELEFGIPLRVPMVDVRAIGAGGGSIASIDRGGVLQVGPASAGAVPGPACYGAGGTRPTVSDANLVLGWLDAGHALGVGGDVRLDIDAARRAIADDVAEPLGLTVEAAAEAIVDVVNARMVEQLRLVSVRLGHDPRELALVAFGGAGPLHAGALMLDAGLRQTVIPAYPGLTSALGCAMAEVRHEFVRTVNRRLDEVDAGGLADILLAHDDAGRRRARAERVPAEAEVVAHYADMQYEGQTHTLRVPVSALGCDGADLRDAFEQAYERRYHVTLRDRSVRLINLRTTYCGSRPTASLPRIAPLASNGASGDPRVGSRRVRLGGRDRECDVFARDRLVAGTELVGPAVVVQGDSTVAIPSGLTASVDELGNLLLVRTERGDG